MADFRSLLETAISRLPENSVASRRKVYERARAAFESSLGQRSSEQAEPLRRALDEAILDIEAREISHEDASLAGGSAVAAALEDIALVAPAPTPPQDETIEALLDKRWVARGADGATSGPMSTFEVLLGITRGVLFADSQVRDESAAFNAGVRPWRRLADTGLWLNVDALLEAAASPTKAGKASTRSRAEETTSAQPAQKPAVPRWEVRMPDGSLRRAAASAELFAAILSGEIEGGAPCRAVPQPGKDGKVKEAKWSRVADTIGASGFEGRVLFRPVWAHSVRGLEIGFTLGFFAWLGLNVWNSLSAAWQLSGGQYNAQGHHLAVKFAAYGFVSLFWLLQSLPLAAQAIPLNPVKELAKTAAPRALQIAVVCLIGLAAMSQDMSAVFAGVGPGLGSAFGSMAAGGLAGGPPGMMIGALVGLARARGLRTAPGWPKESLPRALLTGLLAPAIVSGGAVWLYLHYAETLVNGLIEGFVR